MADQNQEEIDLLFFFKKINNFFKRIGIGIYNGIQFIKRNWIILLVLIGVGIGYGWYVNSKSSTPQKAKMLVRINFDSVNYVYSLIENLNENILDGTLEAEDQELYKVKALQITPIINFRDILDKYDETDRRLEMLLRNIEYEFEDEDEFSQLPETFRSEYKYHHLEVVVSGSSTQETLNALIQHINNNPVLQEVKEVSAKSIQDHIEANEQTIAQINSVLDKYKTDQSEGTLSGAQLYVVDNFDIADIFESKMTLQKQLEDLRRDAVYAKDVVVNVNRPQLYRNLSFSSNGMVYYPIVFVMIFFGLALLRNFYFKIQQAAQEENEA